MKTSRLLPVFGLVCVLFLSSTLVSAQRHRSTVVVDDGVVHDGMGNNIDGVGMGDGTMGTMRDGFSVFNTFDDFNVRGNFAFKAFGAVLFQQRDVNGSLILCGGTQPSTNVSTNTSTNGTVNTTSWDFGDYDEGVSIAQTGTTNTTNFTAVFTSTLNLAITGIACLDGNGGCALQLFANAGGLINDVGFSSNRDCAYSVSSNGLASLTADIFWRNISRASAGGPQFFPAQIRAVLAFSSVNENFFEVEGCPLGLSMNGLGELRATPCLGDDTQIPIVLAGTSRRQFQNPLTSVSGNFDDGTGMNNNMNNNNMNNVVDGGRHNNNRNRNNRRNNNNMHNNVKEEFKCPDFRELEQKSFVSEEVRDGNMADNNMNQNHQNRNRNNRNRHNNRLV